ncbi:hypothetical protein JCGZ_18683 [Jatropha curcas]|uniref:B-like cyclin n=1 Tax=Jatropha curcas TaxID=180498 RepID=A0A067K406_JATCU|nr:cyclin-D4-2 [Jatropha curcas]KDP29748.1 hypothetical protein JCGZ_18683 [Jatropha curcas]
MAQNLLCGENVNTCFNDDLDCNATDEFGNSVSWQNHNHSQEHCMDNDPCKSLMGFVIDNDDTVKDMIRREKELLPRDDYLKRLRSGDLDLSVRREALDWILKARAHYNFGPLSVCLSMNFLDRFLSLYELPKGIAWTGQLLAVACLSIAAKMDEAKVPFPVDLQVGDPKFVFVAKAVQRMELLVLTTLEWRMQALTPCSFIDYFLSKINGNQQSTSLMIKSLQVILSTVKGIDFLEFRPSEISAAVAISVSGEDQTVDIEKAVRCFSFVQIEKDRVLKCIELIKDYSLSSDNVGRSVSASSSVPQSPNGVLEAACLSYKSDDITVGSCANSSHNDVKRRKKTISPFQVEHKP